MDTHRPTLSPTHTNTHTHTHTHTDTHGHTHTHRHTHTHTHYQHLTWHVNSTSITIQSACKNWYHSGCRRSSPLPLKGSIIPHDSQSPINQVHWTLWVVWKITRMPNNKNTPTQLVEPLIGITWLKNKVCIIESVNSICSDSKTQYMILQKSFKNSKLRSLYNNLPFIIECFMTRLLVAQESISIMRASWEHRTRSCRLPKCFSFILPRLVQTFMTHGSHTKQQYFTLSNAPTHHFFTTHEALQTSHWRIMDYCEAIFSFVGRNTVSVHGAKIWRG